MRNRLTNEEIEEIKKNEWVIFTTSDKDKPRSIIVLTSKIEPDQIIISNIQMDKSIKNVTNNPNCFINVYIDNNKQIKIDCVAEVLSRGALFDEIKEYEETNNLPDNLKVHSIIVAKIQNIDIAGE